MSVSAEEDWKRRELNKWISIDERLPENEKEMVLVTDGKTVIPGFRNWMYRTGADSRLFVPGLKMGGGSMQVSHWMQLPKPPRDERGRAERRNV